MSNIEDVVAVNPSLIKKGFKFCAIYDQDFDNQHIYFNRIYFQKRGYEVVVESVSPHGRAFYIKKIKRLKEKK